MHNPMQCKRSIASNTPGILSSSVVDYSNTVGSQEERAHSKKEVETRDPAFHSWIRERGLG